MIVQRFLAWVGGAPAGERADAASALARAYLHSPLDPGDRAAAEAAMTVLLDDASPLVRLALAEALASSPDAPRAIIHALAFDSGEIAAVVLSRSPLLSEAELVDAVAVGDWRAQCSVACRVHVPASLGGAIAEVGDLDACRALLDNPGAAFTPGTLARLLARHGRDAGVRTRLLARPDLPAGVRQMAVAALAEQLSSFAAGCGWLTQERARRVAHEARDKATVTIAVLARAVFLKKTSENLKVKRPKKRVKVDYFKD